MSFIFSACFSQTVISYFPAPPAPSRIISHSDSIPPFPPSLHPFGRQKWNCSEFILCFEQSFVAYFKAVLPAAVMYVLTEGKKNTNKNNQLRFVVEKLQNYAKVRRPPPPWNSNPPSPPLESIFSVLGGRLSVSQTRRQMDGPGRQDSSGI